MESEKRGCRSKCLTAQRTHCSAQRQRGEGGGWWCQGKGWGGKSKHRFFFFRLQSLRENSHQLRAGVVIRGFYLTFIGVKQRFQPADHQTPHLQTTCCDACARVTSVRQLWCQVSIFHNNNQAYLLREVKTPNPEDPQSYLHKLMVLPPHTC